MKECVCLCFSVFVPHEPKTKNSASASVEYNVSDVTDQTVNETTELILIILII